MSNSDLTVRQKLNRLKGSIATLSKRINSFSNRQISFPEKVVSVAEGLAYDERGNKCWKRRLITGDSILACIGQKYDYEQKYLSILYDSDTDTIHFYNEYRGKKTQNNILMTPNNALYQKSLYYDYAMIDGFCDCEMKTDLEIIVPVTLNYPESSMFASYIFTYNKSWKSAYNPIERQSTLRVPIISAGDFFSVYMIDQRIVMEDYDLEGENDKICFVGTKGYDGRYGIVRIIRSLETMTRTLELYSNSGILIDSCTTPVMTRNRVIENIYLNCAFKKNDEYVYNPEAEEEEWYYGSDYDYIYDALWNNNEFGISQYLYCRVDSVEWGVKPPLTEFKYNLSKIQYFSDKELVQSPKLTEERLALTKLGNEIPYEEKETTDAYHVVLEYDESYIIRRNTINSLNGDFYTTEPIEFIYFMLYYSSFDITDNVLFESPDWLTIRIISWVKNEKKYEIQFAVTVSGHRLDDVSYVTEYSSISIEYTNKLGEQSVVVSDYDGNEKDVYRYHAAYRPSFGGYLKVRRTYGTEMRTVKFAHKKQSIYQFGRKSAYQRFYTSAYCYGFVFKNIDVTDFEEYYKNVVFLQNYAVNPNLKLTLNGVVINSGTYTSYWEWYYYGNVRRFTHTSSSKVISSIEYHHFDTYRKIRLIIEGETKVNFTPQPEHEPLYIAETYMQMCMGYIGNVDIEIITKTTNDNIYGQYDRLKLIPALVGDLEIPVYIYHPYMSTRQYNQYPVIAAQYEFTQQFWKPYSRIKFHDKLENIENGLSNIYYKGEGRIPDNITTNIDSMLQLNQVKVQVETMYGLSFQQPTGKYTNCIYVPTDEQGNDVESWICEFGIEGNINANLLLVGGTKEGWSSSWTEYFRMGYADGSWWAPSGDTYIRKHNGVGSTLKLIIYNANNIKVFIDNAEIYHYINSDANNLSCNCIGTDLFCPFDLFKNIPLEQEE